MKLIAHRGLFNGPDKEIENQPQQILLARELGYDCEIDLWKIHDQLFLGHDEPQYRIDPNFLNSSKYWIHAKNLDALYFLTQTTFNYFWHQEDDFTITSTGFIWTYPGKPLTNRSIMLMPEWNSRDLAWIRDTACYGICSDYVEEIKTILRNLE
jgi:hypothetical protein